MAPAAPAPRFRRPRTRALFVWLAFVLGLAVVPHRVCEHAAARWFDGDPQSVAALGAGVARWSDAPRNRALPSATGSRRYDGEWQFATLVMAALGFGQVALSDPTTRAENLARMERAMDEMLDPAVRAFDAEGWDGDALASQTGHVGFLGYAGLALALHHRLAPTSRFSGVERAVLAGLERSLIASRDGLAETYPGETYPVDNAAGLGALGLARAWRPSASAPLARGLAAIRGATDARGLLVQAVGPAGHPRVGRGSGTTLAAYFLLFADERLARALYLAARGELFRTVLGFGAMRELAGGGASADVDSGPVVFGFGVSATGFALGPARAFGDRRTFSALYATAHLFGAPIDREGRRSFVTGGPLGDAILFAMLTAHPVEGA